MSHLYYMYSKKNMAHQRQDETKQPPTSPSTETHTTLTTPSDMYLSTHLIVPYFITAGGEIKRPEHLIAWWSRIFSFLYVPDEKDHIPLRSLCRLFRGSLKPLPLWISFPHPNYPTLKRLMDKLNEMLKKRFSECVIKAITQCVSSNPSIRWLITRTHPSLGAKPVRKAPKVTLVFKVHTFEIQHN